MDGHKESAVAAHLRAPRAGAVAGIVFSILIAVSLTLLRLSVPDSPDDPGRWLADSAKSIDLALSLLPFAGIFFLWFMGVLRDRMDINEDRFLSTVFLGGGLLFLATVFVSSAATAALIMAYEAIPGKLMDSATYTFARSLTYEIANVYALRMAAVFMISTSMINLRIGIFPRWMSFLGFLCALFLLMGVGRWPWSPLVLPVWTFVVSTFILIANFSTKPAVTGAA